MEHHMETIRKTGATPVANVKAESIERGKAVVTRDDTLSGNMLAAEVFAQIRTEAGTWKRYCLRLLDGTAEMRKAFVDSVRAQLRAMREANKGHGGNDDKQARKIVAVAATRIGHLQVICDAMSAGMAIETLCRHLKVNEVELREHVGFDKIVQVARMFKETNAKGRPRDAFIVKAVKGISAITLEGDEEKRQRDILLGFIARSFPAEWAAMQAAADKKAAKAAK